MDLAMELLVMLCVAMGASAVTYAIILRRSVSESAETAGASTEAPDPYVADHADFDEDSPETDSVEIDPANPPKTVFYNPKSDRPAPQCVCHDRPLVRGTEYLWWPMVDGSVRIYCKDRT